MNNKPLLTELTQEEKDIILPVLLQAFRERTSDFRHLKSKQIIDWLNNNKERIGFKGAMNNSRFMKLTNHIRVNGLAPLCASNDGYWITKDPIQIREMIESFENRVASQQAAIQGLKNLLTEIELEGEFGLFEML
jgi:hypothetical protein